jgi:Family of unknown function (DUF6459)
MNAVDMSEPAAVRAIAQHVVRMVNEVVAGARPARQVTPLFTAHLRGTIRRARPEHGGVARVRHLLITSHTQGVYEVVAVCRRAGRTSVFGLQLTRGDDGRWQVTDVAHPQLSVDLAASCPTRRVTQRGTQLHAR